MAVEPAAGRPRIAGDIARRGWLAGTLAATLVPIGVLPFVAPGASAPPAAALGWTLFVGSSVHVASTGWFYYVREVRAHMREHLARFYLAPAALVLTGAAAALLLSSRAMVWLLLAFFAWQFFHFQKQNLGVAALAARAHRVPGPTRGERRALVVAGLGGTAGLIGRPELLQLAHAPQIDAVFYAGAALFAGSVAFGLASVVRRIPSARPAPYVGAYVTSLVFFLPVWLFSSPYAAVAGLTIAHGLQYLLLVGLVAAGTPDRREMRVSLIVLLDIAVLAGLALNRMSHLHDAPGFGRALFGVYLGLTAAHFVVDAGLWRLRDAFPRAFLSRRLPFLLMPEHG